jgi:ketosteroid isomerase-like protein
MPDTHASILEQANAAIMQGDFAGFLDHCTDDTEWEFVGDRTLKGKEAVRQWMRGAYKEPPHFNIQRTIAEGDSLAVLGEITLKSGEGKASLHAYCDVWRFRDNKMAGLKAFVIERR